jgi:polysaccharide biosynthesis/export protein
MVDSLGKLAILALMLAIESFVGQAQDPANQPSNGGKRQPENITYTLGPGDEVVVSVSDAAEIQDLFANSFQIGSDGYLTLPMVGHLQAINLTVLQLQGQITEKLTKYIRDPQVTVNLKSLKSQPVSVLGAVNAPGVHQLIGPRSLAEVLAMAGGFSKDAGYKIDITRQQKQGLLPLPNAVPDSTQAYSTAEIRTQDLTDPTNPQYNITVRPNDIITVQKSAVVYVIGEVRKPGGFTLGEHRTISILQALSLAEGATKEASTSRAKILREKPASDVRVELPINLQKLLNGKAADITLFPNDILIVPDATTKRAAIKIAETTLQTLSGLVIWRGF